MRLLEFLKIILKAIWVLKKDLKFLLSSCQMIKCKYKKNMEFGGKNRFSGKQFMGTIRSTILINKGKILKFGLM